MTDTLGFTHRYMPPSLGEQRTLLLLHGTGGDENDLIPLRKALLPAAGMLSPRGNVLEHGMPRFFRRLAEGVFDQADLARRTEELGQFIDDAAARYGFDRDKVVAVGFSNGANIAASLLLRRANVLRRAILLSPMVPFEQEVPPPLSDTSVFIGAGRADPIVPAAQVDRLAQMLTNGGASVTLHWQGGGHTITPDELEAARKWISN